MYNYIRKLFKTINNMNLDNLKIVPPDGMEWYQEGNQIKFRNVAKKLTYSDVAENLFINKNSHYVGNYGMIKPWFATSLSEACFGNITTSVKQAMKLLAMNKLMNVAKYLNQDWEPDWNKGDCKYYLSIGSENKITIECALRYCSEIVHFKTWDLAEKAIEILGEETIKLALSTDW